MLTFTAVNKDGNKSISLNAEFNEVSNTWTIKTTIDYIDYFINNYVFNHQINSIKSVSKMFKLCQDKITYSYIENDLIEVSIVVDYIDDELIIFELLKMEQTDEEILMKKVSCLEKRIFVLEEENNQLKNIEEEFDYFIMLLGMAMEEPRNRNLKNSLKNILGVFEGNLMTSSKAWDRLRELIR